MDGGFYGIVLPEGYVVYHLYLKFYPVARATGLLFFIFNKVLKFLTKVTYGIGCVNFKPFILKGLGQKCRYGDLKAAFLDYLGVGEKLLRGGDFFDGAL